MRFRRMRAVLTPTDKAVSRRSEEEIKNGCVAYGQDRSKNPFTKRTLTENSSVHRIIKRVCDMADEGAFEDVRGQMKILEQMVARYRSEIDQLKAAAAVQDDECAQAREFFKSLEQLQLLINAVDTSGPFENVQSSLQSVLTTGYPANVTELVNTVMKKMSVAHVIEKDAINAKSQEDCEVKVAQAVQTTTESFGRVRSILSEIESENASIEDIANRLEVVSESSSDLVKSIAIPFVNLLREYQDYAETANILGDTVGSSDPQEMQDDIDRVTNIVTDYFDTLTTVPTKKARKEIPDSFGPFISLKKGAVDQIFNNVQNSSQLARSIPRDQMAQILLPDCVVKKYQEMDQGD